MRNYNRIDKAWKEDWFNHDVPNQFPITDPTIRQPGFDLNRSDWTILNRYHTGYGHCAATLYDWGIRDDPQQMPVNKVSQWYPGALHC